VHTYEAGILEDPNTTPPDDMWKLTVSLQDAPVEPKQLSIESKASLPVKVVISHQASLTDPVDSLHLMLSRESMLSVAHIWRLQTELCKLTAHLWCVPELVCNMGDARSTFHHQRSTFRFRRKI
jgi:hypothetical protein